MQSDFLLQTTPQSMAPIKNAAEVFNSVVDQKGGAALEGDLQAGMASTTQLPFSGVFQEAMTNLRQLEARASSTIEGLVAGTGVDIHEAMIATQKSDLAFEMALAVRGKAVAAYQAIMGVQF